MMPASPGRPERPRLVRASRQGLWLAAAISMALLATGASAYPPPGRTERLSLEEEGGTAYQVTPDGRFVLFVPTAPKGAIHVGDLLEGRTERVDVADDGSAANGESLNPSITDDGRYVAFVSKATNLTPGGPAGSGIYIRDRLAGRTERLPEPPVPGIGSPPNWPFISATGRYVAYAYQTVPTEQSIFLHDRATGITEEAVESSWGTALPTLSADGRYLAFLTMAPMAGGTDSNAAPDVYALDRQTGKVELASVAAPGGTYLFGGSAAGVMGRAQLSADGRSVAFASFSPRLAPEDRNGGNPEQLGADVFVRDLVARRTERVSVMSDGRERGGIAGGTGGPSLSSDGRYVAFASAQPLTPEESDIRVEIYVHDRLTGTTERVSVARDGGTPDTDYSSSTPNAGVTADGSGVVFSSLASNLVGQDYNRASDVFVRHRGPPVGVGELTASVGGGAVSASGWANFSGEVVSDMADPPNDGGALGTELIRARVVYRRALGDLLIDLDSRLLPSVELPRPALAGEQTVAGDPRATFTLAIGAGEGRHEVRVGFAEDAGAAIDGPGEGARHLFVLVRCQAVCTPVALLRGGYGTTGDRVRVSVPLAAIGASEGSPLPSLEATAGLGNPATGVVLLLDRVTMPGGAVPVASVRLGIAPAGTPEGLVTYGPPVTLSNAAFSGTVSTSGLSPGDYDVWARACLGQDCGSSSVRVRLP